MKIMMRVRDNGNKTFDYERHLEIDDNKLHDLIELRQLGIYQNRQYELTITDTNYFVGIATIEEEVQILR